MQKNEMNNIKSAIPAEEKQPIKATLTKAQVEKEIERLEDTISKYRSFEEVTESRAQLEVMRELLLKMNYVDEYSAEQPETK